MVCRLALALLLLPVGGCAARSGNGPPSLPPRPGGCESYGTPYVLARFDTALLGEVSGLVAGDGYFWMHNDSDNQPTLFRVTRDGVVDLQIRLDGTSGRDWEDLADGPCPIGIDVERCLYVGDIGDNLGVRDDIAIHVLPEPTAPGDVTPPLTIALAFPTGPVDAEALVVLLDGTILVVTKGRPEQGESIVYRVPTPLQAGVVHTLEPVARLERSRVGAGFDLARQITSASLSPDGKKMLLRSYLLLQELSIGPDLPASFAGPLDQVPSALEPQGEAIAYDPKGHGYYTVSEQIGDITHVPCLAR